MLWFVISGGSFSEYPRWFVISCAIVASVGILWALAKILKWSLYLLAVLVVVAAATLVLALIFT